MQPRTKLHQMIRCCAPHCVSSPLLCRASLPGGSLRTHLGMGRLSVRLFLSHTNLAYWLMCLRHSRSYQATQKFLVMAPRALLLLTLTLRPPRWQQCVRIGRAVPHRPSALDRSQSLVGLARLLPPSEMAEVVAGPGGPVLVQPVSLIRRLSGDTVQIA